MFGGFLPASVLRLPSGVIGSMPADSAASFNTQANQGAAGIRQFFRADYRTHALRRFSARPHGSARQGLTSFQTVAGKRQRPKRVRKAARHDHPQRRVRRLYASDQAPLFLKVLNWLRCPCIRAGRREKLKKLDRLLPMLFVSGPYGALPTFLPEHFIARKASGSGERRPRVSLDELERAGAAPSRPARLPRRCRGAPAARKARTLIAEIKKASPSQRLHPPLAVRHLSDPRASAKCAKRYEHRRRALPVSVK